MFHRASFGQLLAGIIDRPGDTLANIVAYPRWRWVFPAVFGTAALAAYLIVAAPLLAFQSQQQVAELLGRMPAAQAALAEQQMATLANPRVVAGSAFAALFVGMLAGWLVQAAIVYFGGLLAGGDLEFGAILAATPWLGIPFALENLLKAAYVGLHGRLVVNDGLSYLVSTGNALQDQRDYAYVGLAQITLFRLWHLVLVYALLRVAGKFGRGAALWIALAYALLWFGLQAAFVALNRILQG